MIPTDTTWHKTMTQGKTSGLCDPQKSEIITCFLRDPTEFNMFSFTAIVRLSYDGSECSSYTERQLTSPYLDSENKIKIHENQVNLDFKKKTNTAQTAAPADAVPTLIAECHHRSHTPLKKC